MKTLKVHVYCACMCALDFDIPNLDNFSIF